MGNIVAIIIKGIGIFLGVLLLTLGGWEWKIGKLTGPSMFLLWFSPWVPSWSAHSFCGWPSERTKKFHLLFGCIVPLPLYHSSIWLPMALARL